MCCARSDRTTNFTFMGASITMKGKEKNPAPDKATQQFAWVRYVNSLKAQAEEIVNAELIFC